ncbi:hypothetical protein [Niveibacterium terrae]|uniref:hypothetical protein n=1 Tax=Niveibacterium terrae TaxID=3373598 RepID=UPI003A8FBA12
MSPLKHLLPILLLCSASAHAAEHPRYAVISLIGDQLTIVTHASATGSRLDSNPKQAIQASALALDDKILEEVDRQMPKLAPGAEVSLLGISSEAAYQKGDEALQVPAVRKALEREHPDRIILISKYRGDARLKLKNQAIGSGYLQGIGFYVDDSYRVRDTDTGATGDGFIAPFAYIRLSLLDGHDLREIRTLPVTASYTFSSSRGQSGKAWDALSATEKLSILGRLTLGSVRTHLPELFAN